MRILFVSPRQSHPARSGAKLRESHFLRALCKTADVSFLYFADHGSSPLTVTDLPYCQEVVAVPKPPAYGVLNTARGVYGRWPLPILNYTSTDMDEAAARLMETRKFDLIHLDSIHLVRYAASAVKRQTSLKAIYNWHNIESEAMRRYAGTTSSLARGCYARLTVAKLERVEREILRSAFGHVVCSERERDLLKPLAPQARVAVLENGVDTRYFAECGGGPATGHKIVFVGALDYPANKESAIFFANRIWPQVRSKLSGAELVIVGSNPGPAVLALGKLPGVTVAGMVPDVRPYYAGALASVVPLLTGGGTRLKILEAWAAGVPVVSTPLGAEGLGVVNGENALIVDANDAEGWANRFVALAEDREQRDRLTTAGLRQVQNGYDWNVIGEKLRAVYEGWLRDDASTSER